MMAFSYNISVNKKQRRLNVMAKQALIICAGGMSSSMIAKKTMTYLQ